MNKLFTVLLTVARGACLNIGQTIQLKVWALSPLDAAMKAEKMADATLRDDREYTHATRVDFIPWGETASMAAAA